MGNVAQINPGEPISAKDRDTLIKTLIDISNKLNVLNNTQRFFVNDKCAVACELCLTNQACAKCYGSTACQTCYTAQACITSNIG